LGIRTNRFSFSISWTTNLSVVVETVTNSADPICFPVSAVARKLGVSYGLAALLCFRHKYKVTMPGGRQRPRVPIRRWVRRPQHERWLASGFEVVSTNRTPGPLDTPRIINIDNSVSGQLLVRGTSVLNGRMYQLQFSLDNGATWTNAGINYTGARRMLLTPTTPGKTYTIQICALGGSTGKSAWSNPRSIMAT
jgi:hypothetical protein